MVVPMTRRVASATVVMLSTLVRSVPAFLVRNSMPRALLIQSCGINTSSTLGRSARTRTCCAPLSSGKGFGQTPAEPAKPQKPDPAKARRPAKSLMPLADAASKLLPKKGLDGKATFNNPEVGDFQVFDSLVEYPGSFDLKIIGVNDESFVSDIRKAVAGCLAKGDENVLKCSTREKGKYTSITLKVHVQNSAQLYKCYEVINEDKRVKFKF